jgi:peptidoglycan/LPS O-acetylase OafA/YrhL
MALLERFPAMGRYGLGAASFVLAFAVACAVHVLVEKPCARLRRRLSGGRRMSQPLPTSEREPVGMAVGQA